MAILTDFGLRDGFVGVMKGVILGINPEVQLIDISHEVEPFNILHGALLLKAHFSYFPKGTIFLCVVDPGVGSERLPIVVSSGGYTFVGPYNGLFDLALKNIEDKPKAYKINMEGFALSRINETFHGRDVFAPIAGWLSKGLAPQEVGSPIEYQFKLPWEEPEDMGDTVLGKILYFDRFGNGITNVPCGRYKEGYFRGQKLRVVSYFLEAEKGKPALVCGSFGLMEVFLPMENLKEKLGVRVGESITLKKTPT
ncbi:SAM hydrolase/SAM-dependent halogenase family protein [Pampinifervens diazotrophicum]|uniref:SAM hydrolase/SAM-dependent halogenase family protein n=1 Tax=Pampinifervens diazotrophicum TaxID=1632018 RepID=UPI002B25E0BF|nr:SAM-dependent chlorinase/fluorinase [Hydrogenobacter sp. T-2]